MKSLIVAVIFSIPAIASAELTIFDVRKNLPMSDTDKVYRDFYINGGTEAGLSRGMIITVQRRMPLYDTYQNRSAGDLDLKVAKIKIIHTQKGLSVARMHSEYDRGSAPLLEDNFIMVGDRLDLATATSDKSDKASTESGDGKDQEAAAAAPPPEPLAANIPRGQIVVNSVELSSEAPKPNPQLPQNIQLPIQQ
jgi:hypothetical protein